MQKAIEDFLQHLVVERGFSQHTLDAYRNDLGQFADFLKGRLGADGESDDVWQRVDLDLLNDYIADLRGRKGYRDTTTARKVAAIKSFFTFLAQNGVIEEPPTESSGFAPGGADAAQVPDRRRSGPAVEGGRKSRHGGGS